MATLTPDRIPLRVALVDAHPVFRAGIVQTLLKLNVGCEVVAEGQDAEDAKSIAQRLARDVMVLDLQAELNGKRIREITRECSMMRIIILTEALARDQVDDALRAGAAGYLSKCATGAELAESIKRVHRGEAYFCPSLASCAPSLE